MANSDAQQHPAVLQAGSIIWLMAIAAGVVVANNYYNQPLLNEMSRDLGVSAQKGSWISSVTQLGYAAGLLLLLPLGDRVDRRRMVSVMLCLSALMLLGFAFAASYGAVLGFGFLIGLTSIVPQILPPFASQMVPPERAPEAVARVMAGLLLGIVLSRFVGGWLGDLLGWRAVYVIAAMAMGLLLVVLRACLPRMAPSFGGSYGALMKTLAVLVRRHRTLRLLSVSAALQFAAFSLFWTTLAYHLSAMPGHYPARVAGNFAVIGAFGVMGALAAGRVLARFPTRGVLTAGGVLMLAAFLMLPLASERLLWMVPAVVLLDLGMQVSHVTSMSTVLGLDRASSNRLNTVYMVTRFSGGALGTIVGGLAWTHAGWPAVCAAGIVFCLGALLINAGAWSRSERNA